MNDHSPVAPPVADPTLDAYRRGVEAECEALFGEAMLSRQRSRVLRRLSEPRVLAFPGTAAPGSPAAVVAQPVASSRRWVGLTAAAALMVGLVTGQMVPVADLYLAVSAPTGTAQGLPEPDEATGGRATPSAPGYVSAVAFEGDDALLDAIDVAVSQQGPRELRALDDLTFQYDQR